MGNISPIGKDNTIGYSRRKELFNVIYTKIPIWHLPDSFDCTDFDTDNSGWLESINTSGENEIDSFVRSTGTALGLSKYTMKSKLTMYSDNSTTIESSANNYNVTESYSGNSEGVMMSVKDDSDRIVAEKIYNTEQNDGRKILHLFGRNGENKFEVVKMYNFQVSTNKMTDVINFMYTSKREKFLSEAEFEKEYYLLNGKEVKAEKIGDYKYQTTDDDGNTLIFHVR